MYTGAVYFTLANIDPAMRSKLQAIQVVCLFEKEVLQKYSIDDIMQPFLSDIEKLGKVRLVPASLYRNALQTYLTCLQYRMMVTLSQSMVRSSTCEEL